MIDHSENNNNKQSVPPPQIQGLSNLNESNITSSSSTSTTSTMLSLPEPLNKSLAESTDSHGISGIDTNNEKDEKYQNLTENSDESDPSNVDGNLSWNDTEKQLLKGMIPTIKENKDAVNWVIMIYLRMKKIK